ncbi:MAG: MFS transporter [Acidilobaceae archaeon]
MSKRAVVAFLLLSLVSLLADVTYEGGRSVSGSFLKHLEAPLVAASLIAVGEVIAYAFRLVGGALAWRFASPRAYWAMVFAGYAMNAGIPLLALVADWRLALALYLIERAGKGLRTPVRDALIAELTEGVGRGKAFAAHEVLDQVGAVAGPLAVSLAMSWSGGSYSVAFGVLLAPFAASLVALYAAYLAYNTMRSRSAPRAPAGFESSRPLSARWLAPLLVFAFALGAGFLHWSQASYRLREAGLEDSEIAWLYAVAMLSDALAAVPLGIFFDAVGLRSLILMPALVLLSTLAFSTGSPLLFAIAWGVAMSSFETMLKAAIAVASAARERPLVYALAYVSLGAGWTLGNLVMSYAGVSALYALAVEFLALAALAVFTAERTRLS